MRGNVTLSVRGGLRMLCAALAMGMALVLCRPAAALARGFLEVSQTFSTSGEAPASVTGEFTYRLSSVDGSPLPGGAEGSYEFVITGNDVVRIPLVDGGEQAIAFPHAGVYAYELACVSSGGDGLTVDGSAYRIRIGVENDDQGGLRLRWIEVVDEADGTKPDGITYRHSYVGETPEPQPEPPIPTNPTEPDKPNGPTPSWMPHTGDAEYALLQLSCALLVAGLVALVLAMEGRRRSRKGR